jgi:E3 SUMO-protein ligase RanBP2
MYMRYIFPVDYSTVSFLLFQRSFLKYMCHTFQVTCPGVWLCPNGTMALQINTLNSHVETCRKTPIFPLFFHNKFVFNKVFDRTVSLAELQCTLEQEFLHAKLIQWATPASHGITLAIFETNLVDLLYPKSCFKGLLAGMDTDLLMKPTKYFPVCL